MSVEENKAVVRRETQEMYNHTGNLEATEEIYTSGYVGHALGSPDTQGLEAIKQEVAEFRRAFPDVVSAIEDLVAEGDKVVARWSAQATHQGEYLGVPPTGNRVDFTGIAIYRIEGGKIAESWGIADQLGPRRQIGSLPEPGKA